MNLKEAVLEIIESMPCIRNVLYEGLLNYSATAKYINKEVNELLGKKVSEGSVMLAIRELKIREAKNKSNLKKALITSKYSIDSGLIDYVVYWSVKDISKLLNMLGKEEIVVSTIVGKNYASIISHEEIDRYLRSTNISIIKRIENLSNFRVVIKEEYIEEIGIIENILRSFVLSEIPLIEVASSFTEIGFIINERHVQKALSSYHRLIKKSRVV